MPLPLLRRQKFLMLSLSGTLIPGFDSLEILQQSPQAAATAQHGTGLAARSAEGFDLDAIGPDQADESERRRQLLRVMQLGGAPEVHRRAGVNQGEEMQIFFLEEQLEEQLVEPCVEIPVHEPQIVAGDVIAKIRELDALALAATAAFPFQTPAEDLAADQFQSLQARQQFRAQETGCIRCVGHGGCSVQAEDQEAAVTVHRPARRRAFSDTVSRISSNTRSAAIPSASASKFRITRCRMAGRNTRRTSSKLTL